ncbi:hypothetical protein ACFSCX_15040 [Bacillus salitolerans]|uniref:Lipoprotein n=1 Tax=Bacillus salitolerans TaxID=1437434 RepID=A0ABW4LRT9_9BACI
MDTLKNEKKTWMAELCGNNLETEKKLRDILIQNKEFYRFSVLFLILFLVGCNINSSPNLEQVIERIWSEDIEVLYLYDQEKFVIFTNNKDLLSINSFTKTENSNYSYSVNNENTITFEGANYRSLGNFARSFITNNRSYIWGGILNPPKEFDKVILEFSNKEDGVNHSYPLNIQGEFFITPIFGPLDSKWNIKLIFMKENNIILEQSPA